MPQPSRTTTATTGGRRFPPRRATGLHAYLHVRAHEAGRHQGLLQLGYEPLPLGPERRQRAPLDPAQQPIGRRDNNDKSGLGLNSNWAFSWPSNRRILYNRNSCDTKGKPWNPDKKLMEWDTSAPAARVAWLRV